MATAGSLHLILSTMQGGKTASLLRLIETLGHAFVGGNAILYINSTKDTRGGEYSTHSRLGRGANLSKLGADSVKVERLGGVDVSGYEVVIIDEGNMYPDLIEAVVKMVDEQKKEVYVAGLKGSFDRRAFGQILGLIPHADSVQMLTDTYCSNCARGGERTKAVFTRRTIDSKEEVVIGGSEAYEPVCRECFLTGSKI